MDNTQIHYLTYDPDAMWDEMQSAYTQAGGDVLYPGDEKEMLLRGVQNILMLAFAGIDNALRMDTLRYAQGEYLDIYGEKRNCVRIEAKAAESIASIQFRQTGAAAVIPAGTTLTADGQTMYELMTDVSHGGLAQTVQTPIRCTKTGSAGNALQSGDSMQFVPTQSMVASVTCAQDAFGGQEAEDDETYRERIRTYGLTTVTTGPKDQYETAAKRVTSEILDARAISESAGNVKVYLILQSAEGESAIIQAVTDALNDKNVRPLTDNVSVSKATKLTYTLKLQYSTDNGRDISAAVASAAAEYQIWQDRSIGRAFNPDRLMSAVYQAGANRVTWGTGSEFDGGTVEYTEIEENEYCYGSIQISILTE